MIINAAAQSAGTYPWPAVRAVWGPGRLWTSHAHHSVQVSVALTGTLRVRTPSCPGWQSCQAVIVRPDVTHEIDGRGALVLFVFLDPDSGLAIPLVDGTHSETTIIRDDVASRWQEALGSGPTIDPQRVDLWIAQELTSVRRSPQMHEGKQRVLRHLREDHLDKRQTSLAALAGIAGLSRSRLMHVFTEAIGIPLRPYLLWLRVQRATCALASGRTPTEAAHLAGFSDAPHLVRSLRRTLGTTPRQLLQRVT